MPGSQVSVAGSTSSASSHKGKTHNYRVVCNISQVDESLFGKPNYVTKKQEILDNKCSHNVNKLEDMARERSVKRNIRNTKNKEIVQIITKDLIRNLTVPTEDPCGYSIIFPRPEYQRILQSSKIITKEDREMVETKIKKEKEAAMEQSAHRKTAMRTLDCERQKHEKLTELEEEAKEMAEHLLAKANELRQEQEDEIKHLNELILNAKCHAIRDAQLIEKSQVKHEVDAEEKRLDVMMEVERQNALLIQDEIERKRKEERLIGAAKLLEQITGNEQQRLFELERKDQENIFMQQQTEALMDEDRMILAKKKLDQEMLMHDLNKANVQMLAGRALKLEQEKAEDLKVIEYMKQKAEREMVFEREQERIRIEKEKETARLRVLQECAHDEQANRDALRAKRAQEQAERDWRKKEADEAQRKADTAAMLIVARKKQLQQKEHLLAVQAHRERLEFERVFRVQKELVEKEQREELEKQQNCLKHSEQVRLQIHEREHMRIAERNAFFEEGIKLDEEARLRRARLDEVKKKKLDLLRNVGIPEKYLSQVERKAVTHEHICT